MTQDAVRAVYLAVRAGVEDLSPQDLVLVGCSGGADSLALAGAAARLRARGGPRAGAVVIDHGWAPDSASVAATAADCCRALGLDPVEVVTVAAAGPGGPEAAAREVRYAALEDAARRHAAAAVLLGHTLDDQAETVLLGLGRGSGTRSLAGMPARRGLHRRPLLGLRGGVTRAACAQLGLPPWEDPANRDPAFTRVRVRSLTGALEQALGPGTAQALARTADLLREDADALDEYAGRLLDAAGVAEGKSLLVDVAALAAAPQAVRRRALLGAARRAGSPAGSLGHRHAVALDALTTAVASGSAGPVAAVHLPGRVVARPDCGRLRFAALPPLDPGAGPARTRP